MLGWLFLGLGGALLSCASPGPMNFYACRLAFKRRWQASVLYGCGVAMGDGALGLVAAVSLVGLLTASHSLVNDKTIMSAGGLILCISGVSALIGFRRRLNQAPDTTKTRDALAPSDVKYLGLGFLIGIYHPAALGFWIWVAHFGSKNFGESIAWAFALGIAIGDFLWFKFLYAHAKKFDLIQSPATLLALQRCAAMVMLCAGLFTLYSAAS